MCPFSDVILQDVLNCRVVITALSCDVVHIPLQANEEKAHKNTPKHLIENVVIVSTLR